MKEEDRKLLMAHMNLDDVQKLFDTHSYKVVYNIMEDVAKRMINKGYNHLEIVSGPLSTGGKKDFFKNEYIMKKVMVYLIKERKHIFNMIPFDDKMEFIAKTPGKDPKEEFHQMNLQCYIPFYESGLIKGIYFLPGWKTSTGSSWEHNYTRIMNEEHKLGKGVRIHHHHLSEEDLEKILHSH